MLRIESLSPDDASPAHIRTRSQTRALFTLYGDFLRRTQACAGEFNFPRFQVETETLPADYISANGEVLLALINDAPAACIAFRALAGTPSTAEIKRLFVDPAFRGKGLARILVCEALARIAARKFSRVILDTDPATMPGALELYESFGFTQYHRDRLAYLEKHLS